MFGISGFPSGSEVKESACQCWRHEFESGVRKIPWRRLWQPTPVFLPGKSHGQRSLLGYSKRVGHDWATKQKQLLPLPAVLGWIIHSSELWPFFLSFTCLINTWKALKAESTFRKWLLDYYRYHYPQTTPFTGTCRTSEVHAGYWVRDKQSLPSPFYY